MGEYVRMQNTQSRTPPRIKYNTVIINNENVADFIQDDYPVRFGGYDVLHNEIVVNKYILGDGIAAKYRWAADYKVNVIKNKSCATIPHEMHHWHNTAFFDVARVRDWNHFAHISLLMLDELSARTAGHLYVQKQNNPQCVIDMPKTVASAMRASCNKLVNDDACSMHIYAFMDWFMPDMMNRCLLDSDVLNRQRELMKMYHNNSDALFDDTFWNTVSSFFTFDEYSILRDNSIANRPDVFAIMVDVNNSISRLQQRVSSAWADRLAQIIK